MFGSSINKPYGHIGGKRLLANEILNLFPNNYEEMIYVEPFFGGGSIYFKKDESYKEIINDLDKNIYILLKGLKKYDGNKISNDLNKLKKTKTEFNRILNYKPTNEYDKFIRLYYLKKNSFFTNSTHFNNRKINNIKRNNINIGNKYQERLKYTIILNEDYKKIIKKYDCKNTLFYLDPPYENSNKLYENYIIDFNELNYILNNLKGKFLLSINYNINFIKLFKNFKYKILKTKYANPLIGGQSRKINELIFMNY